VTPADGDRADLTHDLLDDLTAIRGRAQATRRRIGRIKRLSRRHIAADLAQIESRADAMAVRLLEAEAAGAPPAQPTAGAASKLGVAS
jgi:hypothetical protein